MTRLLALQNSGPKYLSLCVCVWGGGLKCHIALTLGHTNDKVLVTVTFTPSIFIISSIFIY